MLSFKYLVAAYLLMPIVGLANADTFTVNGTFGPGTDIGSTCGTSLSPHSCNFSWPAGGTLTGTLDTTGDTVTGLGLFASVPNPVPLLGGPNSLSFDFGLLSSVSFGVSESFDQSGSSANFGLHYQVQCCTTEVVELGINFDLTTGLFTVGFTHGLEGPTYPDVWLASWTGSGTFTVTPLPAAFPLFAAGLGAMGLLGWRRKKRDNPAVATG